MALLLKGLYVGTRNETINVPLDQRNRFSLVICVDGALARTYVRVVAFNDTGLAIQSEKRLTFHLRPLRQKWTPEDEEEVLKQLKRARKYIDKAIFADEPSNVYIYDNTARLEHASLIAISYLMWMGLKRKAAMTYFKSVTRRLKLDPRLEAILDKYESQPGVGLRQKFTTNMDYFDDDAIEELEGIKRKGGGKSGDEIDLNDGSWIEYMDPKSKRIFMYSKATGKSIWKREEPFKGEHKMSPKKRKEAMNMLRSPGAIAAMVEDSEEAREKVKKKKDAKGELGDQNGNEEEKGAGKGSDEGAKTSRDEEDNGVADADDQSDDRAYNNDGNDNSNDANNSEDGDGDGDGDDNDNDFDDFEAEEERVKKLVVAKTAEMRLQVIIDEIMHQKRLLSFCWDSHGTRWIKFKDPLTTRPFAYNVETGESKWLVELAGELAQKPGEDEATWAIRRRSSLALLVDADSSWVKYRDRATKKVFWHNEMTGQSQWEKPTAGTEALEAAGNMLKSIGAGMSTAVKSASKDADPIVRKVVLVAQLTDERTKQGNQLAADYRQCAFLKAAPRPRVKEDPLSQKVLQNELNDALNEAASLMKEGMMNALGMDSKSKSSQVSVAAGSDRKGGRAGRSDLEIVPLLLTSTLHGGISVWDYKRAMKGADEAKDQRKALEMASKSPFMKPVCFDLDADMERAAMGAAGPVGFAPLVSIGTTGSGEGELPAFAVISSMCHIKFWTLQGSDALREEYSKAEEAADAAAAAVAAGGVAAGGQNSVVVNPYAKKGKAAAVAGRSSPQNTFAAMAARGSSRLIEDLAGNIADVPMEISLSKELGQHVKSRSKRAFKRRLDAPVYIATDRRLSMMVSVSEDGAIRLWSHSGNRLKRGKDGGEFSSGDSDDGSDGSDSDDSDDSDSSSSRKPPPPSGRPPSPPPVQPWQSDVKETFDFCLSVSAAGFHDQLCLVCAVKPNGSSFVTAGRDNIGLVWRTEDFIVVGKLRGHSADIICMEFSPDGELIATGSNDHDIFLWSSSSCTAMFRLSSTSDLVGGPVLSAAEEAAAAAEMESAMSKEMELGGGQVGFHGGSGHDAPVVSVTFSGMQSGKAGQASYKRLPLLASCGGDQKVVIWDPLTGAAIYTIAPFHRPLCSVSLRHDGRALAVCDENAVVRVFELDVRGDPKDAIDKSSFCAVL